MIAPLRLLSVSAVSLLFAASPAVDSVAFHAVEGASVQRSFGFELSMELQSMEMTVNGQDVPSDHLEGFELELTETDRVVVTDTYGPPLAERPATLRRSFDELSGQSEEASEGPGGSDSSSKDKSSELEGSVVVFTWDEDDEAYTAEFEDGGDEDLLAELEEDMDLRGFLPDGDVEEGDSWEPGIEAFKRLIEAGGELHLRSDDDERTELDDQLSENLDGEVRVTYAGTRDLDGITVAVLELEVNAETRGEGTQEDGDGGEAQSEVSMQFELEGELYWAIEAGRLHGVELSGEVTARIQNSSEFDGGGESMELMQTMNFEGTVSFEVTVEEA